MPRNRLESILQEGRGSQDIPDWEESAVTCGHDISLQFESFEGLQEYPAPEAIQEIAGELMVRWQQALTSEALRRKLDMLSERVSKIEDTRPLVVPLETLAPEPYRILAPIHVVVRAEQDEYLASWFDANLVASGANPEEAFENLKDILVAVYETFQCLPEDKMGPGPSRQIKVLKRFIARE
jgi:hypothetical protein